MNMDRGTKARIALLVVVLLATMAIEARGSALIDLQFDVTIHDRPVTIRVYQHMTTWVPDDPNAGCLDDKGEYCYTITWAIEITELDTPPTVTPQPTVTIEPPITPTISPTASPYYGPYVASVNSGKFHIPTCRHATRILPANLIEFATRAEAIASGRVPCGTCKP